MRQHSAMIHAVNPPASDAKFVGYEPTWSNFIEPGKYNYEMMRGLNWHNYCASEKDFIRYLSTWIKINRTSTQKEDIDKLKNVSKFNATVCIIARMHVQGFPLNDSHLKKINDYIDNIVDPAPVVTDTTPKKMVSIQDKIKQQVSSTLSDLDQEIDNAFFNSLPDSTHIIGNILNQGFKGPQLKLVSDYLQANVTEWQDAYDNKDEQLAEGYKYVGRRKLKQIIEIFSTILSAISAQKTQLKTQRVIKKKAVDKKKIASKIKHLKEFSELGLKSIDPVEIIGANTLWVYDTKTRRIGVLEGEAKNSLFIRGVVIDGFKKTCSKILRKPEEQLAAFMKLKKNQTMNWLDDIKAKCGELSGRTNSNLVLLRVD